MITSSIENYCRQKRSYSISPSVSFDNNAILTDEEKKEKKFYGATIKEITNELFLSFDDIIKHVNHNLVNNLRPILKGDLSTEEIDMIFFKFLDLTFKDFTYSFDKAEIKSHKFFELNDMNKDISDYLAMKKKKNLMPFQISKTEEALKQESNDKTIMNKFEKEKERFFTALRENTKGKLELELEKKIAENLKKNNTFIMESIKTIKNDMNVTIDFALLDKNLDIMLEEFTKMKNELQEM